MKKLNVFLLQKMRELRLRELRDFLNDFSSVAYIDTLKVVHGAQSASDLTLSKDFAELRKLLNVVCDCSLLELLENSPEKMSLDEDLTLYNSDYLIICLEDAEEKQHVDRGNVQQIIAKNDLRIPWPKNNERTLKFSDFIKLKMQDFIVLAGAIAYDIEIHSSTTIKAKKKVQLLAYINGLIKHLHQFIICISVNAPERVHAICIQRQQKEAQLKLQQEQQKKATWLAKDGFTEGKVSKKSTDSKNDMSVINTDLSQQKEALRISVRTFAIFSQFALSNKYPFPLTLIELKEPSIIYCFRIFEDDGNLKHLVERVLNQIDGSLRTHFVKLLETYVIKRSLGDFTGTKWEVSVNSFLIDSGNDLGIGMPSTVNCHITLSDTDPFSREFDISCSFEGQVTLFECKAIVWEKLLIKNKQDTDYVDNLALKAKLFKQLRDQIDIAQARDSIFIVISRNNLPEDLLDPESTILADDFSVFFKKMIRLGKLICICPRNAANVKGMNFQALYSSKYMGNK